MITGKLYRMLMKIAHKYYWHYAPPVYPEGDTVLWCKWCGFRGCAKKDCPDGCDHELGDRHEFKAFIEQVESQAREEERKRIVEGLEKQLDLPLDESGWTKNKGIRYVIHLITGENTRYLLEKNTYEK